MFPAGELPPPFTTAGRDGISEIVLSRRQIAGLVIYQFLCSLPVQPRETESFADLRPWYSLSRSGHGGAINAYLTALFKYFDQLQQPDCGSKSRT